MNLKLFFSKKNRKSIYFGFCLMALLYCIIKKSTYYLYNIQKFLVRIPLIGDIFKQNHWSGVDYDYFNSFSSSNSYTESGTNIPEEYKNGYTSPIKEGMTADDVIKINKGNNNSSSSETYSNNDALAIFQRWVSSSGNKQLWVDSSFLSLFKYDWIDDENLGSKLCDSIFGGYFSYLMKYDHVAIKNTPSQNLVIVKKCVAENQNFIEVYNKFHDLIYSMTKKFVPIITKKDFRDKGINPDSSKLYEYRTNWGSNDLTKLEVCRQQLINWLDPYIVKVNENFHRQTNYTIL